MSCAPNLTPLHTLADFSKFKKLSHVFTPQPQNNSPPSANLAAILNAGFQATDLLEIGGLIALGMIWWGDLR
jgi:hypothetical protein